ncbi:uncharacterized protein At4g22758-like [Impatiens glandulifera]|uniref:uncharacterized protein At4g22758-like n=1 Tax=Impatiens glandulifera TaxID=253017 RepID=UPI001FB09A58|nr:uncharacterized protein At4g22758-like [Impatiens glandulifera]
MSERDYRRTNSASSRPSSRLPQLHPSSPHRRKTPPSAFRRSSKSFKHVEIMHRSSSEPSLFTATNSFIIGEDNRNLSTPEGVLYRPQTCTDMRSSPQSPPKLIQKDYNRDAKVVVNVMVEGSPGPVRVMLKLGSSVEEAIKLVVNKYGEEWRSPLLDKSAASSFELHQSYFSLECLDRSILIGDLGARSFYLRKGRGRHIEVQSGPIATQLPLIFFSGFIVRNINKIIRRTRKLWTLFGCMHCDG